MVKKGGSSPRQGRPSGSTLGVAKPSRSRARRGPVERQYVGIDLHRRRSVIVRIGEDGEELGTVRIENDPIALSLAVAEAGPNPEGARGAVYGWDLGADGLHGDGAG